MDAKNGKGVVSKIDISRITIDQLDATCLTWITKFAVALQKHNGEVLALREQNLLANIVSQAKRTDSAELRNIYVNLKSALRWHLSSQQHTPPVLVDVADGTTPSLAANSPDQNIV
jgi:hypothetical protein